MSRVHDALRRAEQLLDGTAGALPPAPGEGSALVLKEELAVAPAGATVEVPAAAAPSKGLMRPDSGSVQIDARAFLARCKTIPFHPAPEAHLINPEEPHDGASEEFRSLRTRLNHMQAQQDLRVIVCTSASPAEGKTFTACNLALAQAQLEAPILLADLDLRRPVVHQQFQCERSPGFSDFLLGEKALEECIRHIEGTNLYFMPAGSAVRNPLELLNMRPVRYTLDSFRKVFNWVILDTPPLLFSADANLLATITDGIILVVRIGSTTYDSVVRAIQTLCENNVLGIVANGARAGELYSKYTYYYTKSDGDQAPEDFDDDDDDEDDDDRDRDRDERDDDDDDDREDEEPLTPGPAADSDAEAAPATAASEGPAETASAASVDGEGVAAEPMAAAATPEPSPAPKLSDHFLREDEIQEPPMAAAAPPAKKGFFARFTSKDKAPKAPKPAKVKPVKAKPPVEVDEDEDDDW